MGGGIKLFKPKFSQIFFYFIFKEGKYIKNIFTSLYMYVVIFFQSYVINHLY
jgi:hypothetical protein